MFYVFVVYIEKCKMKLKFYYFVNFSTPQKILQKSILMNKYALVVLSFKEFSVFQSSTNFLFGPRLCIGNHLVIHCEASLACTYSIL